MAQRIPILYLITSTNVGGTEKALYELISRLDKSAFQIWVCSLKKPGRFAPRISSAADCFYSLGLSEAGGLRALISFVPALARLISLMRRLDPVIVHCFLFRANIMGRIAGKLAGVPVIISSIRVVEHHKIFKHLIDRFTSTLTDKYLAVSEGARSFTIRRLKLAPEKIVTIYNGIGTCRAAHRTGDQAPGSFYHIALIGRFDRQKGHDILLRALPIVLQDTRDLRVYFWGSGPEEMRIKNLAAREGLTEHISFMGEVDDIASWLKRMDVIVLPSLWEGLPNVLLEAMAAGRPVIASRVEGIDEVVLDGTTGILCRPGDAADLARALLMLKKNRALAEQMGRAGRLRVLDMFSIDTTVQATIAVYRELLAKKAA